MPKCTYCGAPTQLWVNEQPICIDCDKLTPKQRAVKLEDRKAGDPRVEKDQ
jgi:hypothetical protein